MAKVILSGPQEYKILDYKGLISVNNAGWTKELNVVSADGAASKYLLNSVSPARKEATAGIMFTDAELKRLHHILLNLYGIGSRLTKEDYEELGVAEEDSEDEAEQN